MLTVPETTKLFTKIQLPLPLLLQIEAQPTIVGQPIVSSYLHDRLPYTVQVLGGKFAGESLIYLIHFDQMYQHTRHYIGSTNDLERRFKEHQRKHPCFTYQGRRYRRYSTIMKALAQDYSAQELDQRMFELLRQARRDHGVLLLMAVNRAGVSWQIAQVWQADRSFEFFLKRRKHASRFCPVCNGTHEDKEAARLLIQDALR